jgi:hypothetical protein
MSLMVHGDSCAGAGVVCSISPGQTASGSVSRQHKKALSHALDERYDLRIDRQYSKMRELCVLSLGVPGTGEGFDYWGQSPEWWLLETSGLPFGLTGDMIREGTVGVPAGPDGSGSSAENAFLSHSYYPSPKKDHFAMTCPGHA